MCGRYRLTAKERWLSSYFNLDPEDIAWAARWNIAPTEEVPVIRQDPKEPRRRFTLMRWGLIPWWAKNASIGARAINAVSETAAEKPAFRDAMKLRRCLIPADGFYEWKRTGPRSKQAYNIGLSDDALFAFAGLWENWKDSQGKTVKTCTILTTHANALLAGLHDRMPVILRPEDYALWLDPGMTDAGRVADLLKPFDPRLMRQYPVSDYVNRAGNEGPECAKESSEKEVDSVAPAQQKLW